MIIIKILFLWVICFYVSIIVASLIKGVKLNLFSISAYMISPIMFLRLNSEIIKSFCKFLSTEENVIVTKKNKTKLKIQMAIFTFPDFLNFYFDVVSSMQIEMKTDKIRNIELKEASEEIDKKFTPYKENLEHKLSCC